MTVESFDFKNADLSARTRVKHDDLEVNTESGKWSAYVDISGFYFFSTT